MVFMTAARAGDTCGRTAKSSGASNDVSTADGCTLGDAELTGAGSREAGKGGGFAEGRLSASEGSSSITSRFGGGAGGGISHAPAGSGCETVVTGTAYAGASWEGTPRRGDGTVGG